jgi:hypothetical protein
MRQLKEGKDFYYNEDRNVVFTASYHLQRGSCCGNGCRHCPFNHCNVQDVIEKKITPDGFKSNEETKAL